MKKLLCIALALTLCVLAAACSPKTVTEGTAVGASGSLTVHFIDVGQGDCTLLESDGEFVLIDAGEFDYGETVLNYIKERGAQTLSYVIATHPHSDHIGGIRTVINSVKAKNFITVETDCDTFAWTKLLRAVDELGINYIDAAVGDTYSFGSSSFTVMGPVSNGYEGYNGYSVVIKAVCQDISFLLMGDAEKINEYEMIDAGEDLDADVLKCGHHGSSSSTSTRFLQAVNPVFAVVSCGAGNDYGHPHRETVEQLDLLGCSCFTTAERGTIIASTNGKTLTIRSAAGVSISEKYTAGTPKNPDSKLWFVGNKNSGYFHEPVCEGVQTMKPKNKVTLKTREEAIKEGFTPCPSCNP